MTLRKIGPNAAVLETRAGAILFSYENPTALRLVSAYSQRQGPISRATNTHISRFVPPGVVVSFVTPDQFTAYLHAVLSEP